MFRFFESIVAPTGASTVEQPPSGLLRFYWYFVRQAKPLLAALFAAGLFLAVVEASVPWFIGRLVRAVSNTPPADFLAQHAGFLVAMASVVLVVRPLAIAAQALTASAGIAVNLTNLVRWQSHLHVVRQSLALLPERLRRPHRGARDGDRPGGPAERGRDA